jgi:hypothetical protein
MKLETRGNGVDVYEVIKTIADSQNLISTIDTIKNGGSVTVRIHDSFTLPSSVIGYLLKLNDSNVSVHLEVKDDVLYELLSDLSLTQVFNVRKL